MAVPVVLEIHATPDVNANPSGEAHPIKVDVMELKSTNKFNQGDYFTLSKDARNALGEEVTKTESVVLRPGETKEFKYEGSVESESLGIVAGYRDINNAHWRQVVDLPRAQTTNFYKFWQSAPDEVRIRVDVAARGLSVMPARQD